MAEAEEARPAHHQAEQCATADGLTAVIRHQAVTATALRRAPHRQAADAPAAAVAHVQEAEAAAAEDETLHS